MSKTEKHIEYYPNGNKKEEGTYKDGKDDKITSLYWENGRKQFEGTFKNGEHDGKMTVWYESGQKDTEKTYKDGKFISEKYWN